MEKQPGLYVVNDGSILAYSAHESGRRRVIFIAGWMQALLLTPTFLADVTTVDTLELYVRESSEICFIPYAGWNELEQELPGAYAFTKDILSRQMNAMLFSINARMEKDISRRLAMVLLRLYGKLKEGNTIRISHEELAEIVGVAREVVTRNVAVLKEKGFVETGREKIRVTDLEQLTEYAGGVIANDTEG
ncbi:MAG: Crp/Fnr family transcriptional regulator [Lachnospiraceae bacterium]|nr:Crp/Fnr family transcriptional regulator [Lachnospiraceae bacterium]